MKKLIVILMIGFLTFGNTFSNKAEAEAINPYIVGAAITAAGYVTAAVIDGISSGCNEKRKQGHLQKRCKNQDCVFVSCISLRKICGEAAECQKGDN